MSKEHYFEQHNAACEQARLSACNCYCRGAGHQYDLVKRCVSVTTSGANGLSQFLADIEDVYGGFHTSERDFATPTRRPIPNAAGLNLESGRGASWVERLLVDEALHAAFVQVAQVSITLSSADRAARADFVHDVTEGAFRIVGGDLDSHNVVDGHVWCSVVAEAVSTLPATPSPRSGATTYSTICYPRSRTGRIPMGIADVRAEGIAHLRGCYNAVSGLVGRDEIVRLIGAASCPDLWHHPAAVRFALRPFVVAPSWPPADTTTLAKAPRFNTLETRWSRRNHW
ncbi:hypothetical protein [Demequina salsinemoris]|uniref:hypothetical protein n=1 Tax=Demequina salsinemoris TaxID=577470 RepID=UPI000AB2B6C7|nr:hypothetical protein [Demequina salsinemoris]